MQIQFLGATGTVTGSKYLLEHLDCKILIDCGLFQGFKQLRLRNWSPLPLSPSEIDAVILTHAHIDHSGYIPLLVKNGFKGPIYCTHATYSLCQVLLLDSAKLQEEEAEYLNKHRFSKHQPALPLYTREDAEKALALFVPLTTHQKTAIGNVFNFELLPAGHILGSAMVLVHANNTSVLFSGDLGRQHDLVMNAPAIVQQADYVVVESTYGNRSHDDSDPVEKLGQIINKTIARGGKVIIPTFAVGRAQLLLYCIHLLKQNGAIPTDLPIYLNSPMAVEATAIFDEHQGEYRLTQEQTVAMCKTAKIVSDVAASKALNNKKEPFVVLAGSGMATGGRIVHHLKAFAPDPRNTILFSGFQAGGTRGAKMLDGASEIKIHGEYVPIHAEIALLDNLSAHADANEILAWLGHFKRPPKKTFITHGEPAAADALRCKIKDTLHWDVCVPEYLDKYDLISTI